MKLEIRPEPTDGEREAIAAALARAGLEAPRPPAYESPWRLAALRDATRRDGSDP
jgi:hypothetical protein